MSAPQDNLRLPIIEQWLAEQLSGTVERLDIASADASFRRYFRATLKNGETRIVMDAPPAHEDSRPFVMVAGLMKEAGVHVPDILASDLDQGLLLLSDLGTQTYLDVLSEENADAYMRPALDSLVRWQLASRENVLPACDATLLRRELDLFPDWCLEKHLGMVLDDTARQTLAQVFALLIASACQQPRVFVHRDYMPRNLMVSDPQPGVLDFQDAVYGPISYDIASLCRDAFISWEEERVLDWTIRYWEKARQNDLPVPSDFAAFWRDVEWMGLQRHLKILGIFCRLHYRDGKARYLGDLPRFVGYARTTAERYSLLKPLLPFLDAIDGRVVENGYTF